MRGWLNYFRYARCKGLLKNLDSWIRRKLRCYRLKQCKRVITLQRFLESFALWGFANDITNPMVKSFSKIFRMSVTEGALVQLAFYGGYFVMAFPAAIFIRKFSYKSGIMIGLLLYAIGAFMFFPAKVSGSFYPFLIAYFILTCGLSFLETSANPYILMAIGLVVLFMFLIIRFSRMLGTSFPAVNASFVLPLICFTVVARFGRRAMKRV